MPSIFSWADQTSIIIGNVDKSRELMEQAESTPSSNSASLSEASFQKFMTGRCQCTACSKRRSKSPLPSPLIVSAQGRTSHDTSTDSTRSDASDREGKSGNLNFVSASEVSFSEPPISGVSSISSAANQHVASHITRNELATSNAKSSPSDLSSSSASLLNSSLGHRDVNMPPSHIDSVPVDNKTPPFSLKLSSASSSSSSSSSSSHIAKANGSTSSLSLTLDSFNASHVHYDTVHRDQLYTSSGHLITHSPSIPVATNNSDSSVNSAQNETPSQSDGNMATASIQSTALPATTLSQNSFSFANSTMINENGSTLITKVRGSTRKTRRMPARLGVGSATEPARRVMRGSTEVDNILGSDQLSPAVRR